MRAVVAFSNTRANSVGSTDPNVPRDVPPLMVATRGCEDGVGGAAKEVVSVTIFLPRGGQDWLIRGFGEGF